MTHDAYDPGAFPPVAVTVDIAVFTVRDDELHVLLVERGEEPFLGAFALPGGFVKPDEDLDQAAVRELAEETGLRAGDWHLEQLGSYGRPGRDPRMRVVTVAYWAIAAELPRLRAGGDAMGAVLKPVAQIESRQLRLAFDHAQIVRDAVERTRARLDYTALAAKFCPPAFTIAQLRRVYEAVWNTRIDPGNFQRNVQKSGAFERADSPELMDVMNAVPPGLVGDAPPPVKESRSVAEPSTSPPVRRGRPASYWSVSLAAAPEDWDQIPLARPPARRWPTTPGPKVEGPEARLTVLRLLKRAARYETTVHYSVLGDALGLSMRSAQDRSRLFEILAEIDGSEHEVGNPMLTAVVVLEDGDRPGRGFFRAAHRLGRYDGNADAAAQLEFWQSELQRVYRHWAGTG